MTYFTEKNSLGIGSCGGSLKILITLYSFYTTKLVKTDLLTDAFDLKMVTKSSINCKGEKKKESTSHRKANCSFEAKIRKQKST